MTQAQTLQLRIPSATRTSPGLQNIGTPTVPQSTSVGEVFARAGQQASDTLVRLGLGLRDARRARALTAFDTDAMTAISNSEIEANQVDPAESMDVYDEGVKGITDRLNEIDDEFVRGKAELSLDRLVAAGRITVTNDIIKREGDISRSLIKDRADGLLVAVAESMDAQSAANLYEEAIEPHRGVAYSEEGANAAITTFKSQAAREEFNRLLAGTIAKIVRGVDDGW